MNRISLLARGAGRYMQGLLRLNRGPLYLIHFITLRCNADCGHCFVPINTGRNEMGLEEIRRFTEQCPPLLYVSLTGGEPLLREDYAEIVAAYWRGPRPVILHSLTNGAFPEKAENLAEEICRRFSGMVFSLGVSIDGLKAEHDRIRRRPGLFEKAMETVLRLRRLEKKYPSFRTEINFTVTAGNQAAAPQILSEIGRLTGDAGLFFTIQRKTYGPAGSPGILPRHYQALLEPPVEKQRGSGALSRLFHGVAGARNRLILRILREQRMVTQCLAGRLAGVVWDDGRVFACELRTDPIGSLRESGYDLRRIWRGPSVRRMSSTICGEKCFCTHECFNSVNLAFKPLAALRFVR